MKKKKPLNGSVVVRMRSGDGSTQRSGFFFRRRTGSLPSGGFDPPTPTEGPFCSAHALSIREIALRCTLQFRTVRSAVQRVAVRRASPDCGFKNRYPVYGDLFRSALCKPKPGSAVFLTGRAVTKSALPAQTGLFTALPPERAYPDFPLC